MRVALYPVTVDAVDTGFLVTIPDFEEIAPITVAEETLAYEAALEAANQAADERRKAGNTTPTPTELHKVARGRPTKRIVFMVPVSQVREFARVNLIMNPHLLRRIDHAATERKMTRSAFLSELAHTGLMDQAQAF